MTLSGKDDDIVPIPIKTDVIESYARQVYAGKIVPGQVDADTWQGYYEGFKNTFERSIKSGMLVEYGPDWSFNQQIVSNLATFSAFKNHSNTKDLVAQLVSDKGEFKSYRQWRKDVDPILQDYNEHWLKAEHQTATAAARMAEKWRNFQRRKATYPNLRYVTQEDERVRASHRPLHGIIRPVDDPFWDVFYPPNGYRCRCNVIQTDEPVTGSEGDYIVPETWRHNVGKEADLFGQDHPYREEAGYLKERVMKSSNYFEGVLTRVEVFKWALKHLRGVPMVMPGMGTVTMGRKDIKEWLHSHMPHNGLKNNLLYVIRHLLEAEMATFLYKKFPDPTVPKHRGVRWFHYYLLKIEDKMFYLNFKEMKNGDKFLYGVTPHIK